MLMVSPLLLFLPLAVKALINPTKDTACSCSSGFVPVPVDVTIPVNPSDPTGLNSTDTFRLQTIFEVFGELCEPVSADSTFSHAIQLLLHGQSYTSQYWDVSWNGFQNYSYVALSCSKGISSFAYDNLGAGRTTRPQSSTECQMPTAGNVSSSLAKDLKSGAISRILTGREMKYDKVIGFGHSLGSATLNYAAIGDGENSPFDALVLTGSIHDPEFIINPPVAAVPASQVDPARFPNLDPGYITTPNISARMIFYGPTLASFSLDVFNLDELTKDAGSHWLTLQIRAIYTPAARFKAPVVELVGSFDKVHCLPNGAPCDQTKLQTSEAIFFPDSKNFSMIVIDGFGHDLNLEFAAAKAFTIMNQLFERFAI
ncbi:hypothetical protein K439DRAFT_1630361 [Ramaria rubella]|nr:hypothetical protein K439DRAFT_1630361 [Ramaria rubella]